MMAGGEIQSLPELLIQRVQYFLTPKEAARTAVLSKSWGSAWLTRPNLVFDWADFRKDDFSRCYPFSEFAEKTLKRYEDSNLKIDSFCLRIKNRYGCDQTLITNMTLRALKLGATRLAFYTLITDFVLPNEVFASENLIELTLDRCEIDLVPNRDVIRCSRLQSLSLEFVEGQGYREVNMNMNDTLFRIISSCPLIEKLSLCYISSFSGGEFVLPRLRSLELDNVEFDTLFLRGLASNFPSLKDLTLRKYRLRNKEEGQLEEVLISSPSLERLHLKTERKESWRFKLVVPSIRTFTCESESIPSLSFRSTSSGGWESHVRITHYKSLHNSWFRRLSKLLTKLRRSRIYLSLRVRSFLSFHHRVGDIQGLPKRMIENLTMDLEDLPYLNCYALLDGLFLMCRPKSITPLNNIDFIGETILQAGLNVKFSTPKQFMYGLKDLEEARARFFDSVVSQWRNVALDEFLDDSTSTPPEDTRDVSFHLKWHS